MHASVLDFVTRALGRDQVEGMRVLEVGSRDVNGSVKPYITSLRPAEYIGVDRRPGRRVDVVVRAEELVKRFAPDSFDVVVCVETLEHVLDWRLAIWNMAMVLRTGGLLVLTTRAPGFPRHDHPADHWRFTVAELRLLVRWWPESWVSADPEAPGVFVQAVKSRALTFADIDYVKAERAPAAVP